ncbi:dienelactone hydrolase family protein [Colwellia sp. Bg11-28]|uniref:dienelactone hydrolase family protein n=1 Tax=Colwellia sp. Bg11-28 TaxID=2058305 RepID=UPI000C337ACE|nr:alpha/beta hydrolase [Colwellia sp. Bg11-28]PKH89111.1 alpha/beta hydrolase [Colwellia sp. Bg11-28]
MLRLITTLSFASLLITANSFAAEITLTTPDNFALKADYYPSNNGVKPAIKRAVLMLHQCNYNRTMYDNIGAQLAQQSIHALSLDFRGFGESISSEFNVADVRKLPQAERGKAWSNMSSHWPEDVQLAFNYLKEKVGNNGKVGIIGASCGGSQAINLAEKESISAISFFSSSQRDENIARYGKTLIDTPTLIIASEDDGRTFTSAQQLFSTAKNPSSKMISYKGSMHGYPLLDSDKALETTIVTWFSSELNK